VYTGSFGSVSWTSGAGGGGAGAGAAGGGGGGAAAGRAAKLGSGASVRRGGGNVGGGGGGSEGGGLAPRGGGGRPAAPGSCWSPNDARCMARRRAWTSVSTRVGAVPSSSYSGNRRAAGSSGVNGPVVAGRM